MLTKKIVHKQREKSKGIEIHIYWARGKKMPIVISDTNNNIVDMHSIHINKMAIWNVIAIWTMAHKNKYV